MGGGVTSLIHSSCCLNRNFIAINGDLDNKNLELKESRCDDDNGGKVTSKIDLIVSLKHAQNAHCWCSLPLSNSYSSFDLTFRFLKAVSHPPLGGLFFRRWEAQTLSNFTEEKKKMSRNPLKKEGTKQESESPLVLPLIRLLWFLLQNFLHYVSFNA